MKNVTESSQNSHFNAKFSKSPLPKSENETLLLEYLFQNTAGSVIWIKQSKRIIRYIALGNILSHLNRSNN